MSTTAAYTGVTHRSQQLTLHKTALVMLIKSIWVALHGSQRSLLATNQSTRTAYLLFPEGIY